LHGLSKNVILQEEIYKNKQIRIEIDEDKDHFDHGKDKTRVFIDNQHIHIMNVSDNQYSTHYLPYFIFPNLMELAKTVIDKVPLFNLKKK
jgi:hypothetical protein